LTSAASATSLAKTASKALFHQKKHPNPNDLIITDTKTTNTGHALWNGSLKNMWYPF
jgi:hypothetical protein